MTADNPTAGPTEPEGVDLIRAAARAGFAIIDRMLETFRGQGLIPRPHRAGYRGRAPVWRYPPGTDRQLVALLRWRQRTKDPNLLRVLLWLDGFPIPVSAVRQALAHQLQVMMSTLEQAIDRHARRLDLDPVDAAADGRAIDALARTVASKRGVTPIPRRSRVAADDRAHAVSMMLRMFILGQAIEGTAAEAATMERVIGIAPKGRQNAIGDSEPWLTGPAEDLFGLASSIALPNLLKAVVDATDANLTAARQTVISLVRYLPIMVRMIGALSDDENYTGLAGIGQIDQHPEVVLILIPIVLTMMEAGRSADLDAVTSALQGVPKSAPLLRRIPDMHIKTLADNLAGQPEDVQKRARRLIDASLRGDLDEHLPFSDTHES